jgi:hypothetical protein
MLAGKLSIGVPRSGDDVDQSLGIRRTGLTPLTRDRVVMLVVRDNPS